MFPLHLSVCLSLSLFHSFSPPPPSISLFTLSHSHFLFNITPSPFSTKEIWSIKLSTIHFRKGLLVNRITSSCSLRCMLESKQFKQKKKGSSVSWNNFCQYPAVKLISCLATIAWQADTYHIHEQVYHKVISSIYVLILLWSLHDSFHPKCLSSTMFYNLRVENGVGHCHY